MSKLNPGKPSKIRKTVQSSNLLSFWNPIVGSSASCSSTTAKPQRDSVIDLDGDDESNIPNKNSTPTVIDFHVDHNDFTDILNTPKVQSDLHKAKENVSKQSSCRQWKDDWQKLFPFLFYDSAKNMMTCKTCIAAHKLNNPNLPFVVGSNNFKLDAIRKHSKSELHLAAECKGKGAIEKTAIANTVIGKYILKLSAESRNKIEKLFNTAYTHAKYGIPACKFSVLCNLQMKNGVDLGNAYTGNRNNVNVFQKYISLTLLETIKSCILKCGFFGICIDSSIDKTNEDHEIIYVTYVDEDGISKTQFLGIYENIGADAKSIIEGLNGYFKSIGLESWKTMLIALTTDGASVYTGKFAGVWQHLKDQIPSLLTLHCLCHKVELELKSVISGDYITMAKNTINDIFKRYRKSSKKWVALKAIGNFMNETIKKFGSLPKQRWLMHHFKSFKTIECDYNVIYADLQNDVNIGNKEAANILSSIKKMSFCFTLALLLDITEIVGRLSNSLQKHTLHCIDALDNLEFYSLQIQGLKHSVSARIQKVVLIDKTKFELEEDVTWKDFETFYISTVDLVSHALIKLKETSSAIIKAGFIFDPSMWPHYMPGATSDLTNYGIEEIKLLFDHFSKRFSDMLYQDVLNEWNQFKMFVSTNVANSIKFDIKMFSQRLLGAYKCRFPTISKIFLCLSLLCPSSSNCESGFSVCHRIKNQCPSLHVSTLNTRVMINLNGPEIENFNPQPAVSLWLADAERRFNNRNPKQQNPSSDDHNVQNNDEEHVITHIQVDELFDFHGRTVDCDVMDYEDLMVNDDHDYF